MSFDGGIKLCSISIFFYLPLSSSAVNFIVFAFLSSLVIYLLENLKKKPSVLFSLSTDHDVALFALNHAVVAYDSRLLYRSALFLPIASSSVTLSLHRDDMCEIKHTIRFQFSHGQEKPDMDSICNFAKGLDADPGQMEAVYRIGEERSIFIKFRSEEAMLHALNFNTEELIFHYANGKTAEVHMSNASEYIEYIRIYDLPPEVPDSELEKVLKKYGKVKRVIREKFPVELNLDALTGVRGVYMDVKKEIPTSLHFLNRKGNIFYDGNKGRCFLCKAEGHLVLSCPKRKARKQPGQQNQGKNEGRSDPSSYAGVVTGAAAAEMIEVLDEEVMAIDEMTPQTDGNRKEEQASGSQVQPVDVNDPKYAEVKSIFDKVGDLLKQKTKEMEKEERRKLQARSKGNRKQSPPRSPHRKS